MIHEPMLFKQPQTKQEYIALLDDAIWMARQLNRMWSELFQPAQGLYDQDQH